VTVGKGTHGTVPCKGEMRDEGGGVAVGQGIKDSRYSHL